MRPEQREWIATGAIVQRLRRGGIDRKNTGQLQSENLPPVIYLASKYIFLMYLDFAAIAALNASCVCY